jgi:hypothetical protein
MPARETKRIVFFTRRMQPIHLQDQITLEHHLDLGRRTREFRETILDDRHVLYLPLRHGKVTVISNGKRLHDAPVLPGMMRLSSPGEEVCTTVHAAFVSLCFPRTEKSGTLRLLRLEPSLTNKKASRLRMGSFSVI